MAAAAGALAVLVTLMFRLQGDFQADHEPFVRRFLTDYSKAWRIEDVRDRVSKEMLLEIQSGRGEEAVSLFRRMGPLREITSLEVENYFAGAGGSSGIFELLARFENAPALVTLRLEVEGDVPRVTTLRIDPLEAP